jgi:hypothetical protein
VVLRLGQAGGRRMSAIAPGREAAQRVAAPRRPKRIHGLPTLRGEARRLSRLARRVSQWLRYRRDSLAPKAERMAVIRTRIRYLHGRCHEISGALHGPIEFRMQICTLKLSSRRSSSSTCRAVFAFFRGLAS